MSDAGPIFRSTALAWLIVAATTATIAAVLLLAFGGDLAERRSAGADTYSDSAVGHRAAFEFLEAGAFPCVRNHDPGAPALTKDAALLLLEPDWSPDHPLDYGLLPHLIATAARLGSPVIVVLPKWLASTSSFDPRFVDGVTPAGGTTAQAVAAASVGVDASNLKMRVGTARATYRVDTDWGLGYDVVLSRAQVMEATPGLTPLISCADGWLAASVRRPGGSTVVLVADPDLFNNQGLGKADHAALLQALIEHLDGVHALVFDETIHGDLRRGRILASLMRFPALPIALQCLVVGLAAFWAFSGRFGSPRDLREGPRGGREVFVEITARLLEGSVEEGGSLARYWANASDAVSRACRIPVGDQPLNLIRLAQESSARRTIDDPRTLAAEVAVASTGPARPELWIAVATKIDRWRREMMHGPRTTP